MPCFQVFGLNHPRASLLFKPGPRLNSPRARVGVFRGAGSVIPASPPAGCPGRGNVLCVPLRASRHRIGGWFPDALVPQAGRICKPKPSCNLRGPSGRVLQPLVVQVLGNKTRSDGALGHTLGWLGGCSKFLFVQTPFLCCWKPKSQGVHSRSGCYTPPSTHSSHHYPSSRASNTIASSNENGYQTCSR